MKYVIVLWALLALMGTGAAFAGDGAEVAVSCRDAREDLRDAGFLVSVTKGGFAGLTFAKVSEQTIAGPQKLGTLLVFRRNSETSRTYMGNGFTLSIELDPSAPADSLAATMSMRRIEDGDRALTIQANLLCELHE